MEKMKVLIVDDAMDMRIFISVLFKTGGFHPVAVRDGKEGIRKAREIQPDLIILDVMMPDEGGANMYRALKADEALAGIPVIMLSAVEKKTFTHFLNMLRAQQEGELPDPDAYLEKPPDPQALLDLARSLLDRPFDSP